MCGSFWVSMSEYHTSIFNFLSGLSGLLHTTYRLRIPQSLPLLYHRLSDSESDHHSCENRIPRLSLFLEGLSTKLTLYCLAFN